MTTLAITIIEVEKKTGVAWRETLTALAALASPLVALFVAAWVTSKTIANDREQRALDRAADREQTLHDRKLTASADFADAAHKARVAVTRSKPPATTTDLDAASGAVEDARTQLARIQLLFHPKDAAVRHAAEAVVNSLTTAQRAAARASALRSEIDAAAGDVDREPALLEQEGEARAKYTEETTSGESSYETFLTAARSALRPAEVTD